jgi:regulator of RNase E activity RraB
MGWDVYTCRIDGRPAVISLDLDLRGTADSGTHPQRLHVRHTLRSPRENGLPDGSENEAMYALQDALAAALGEHAQAVYLACLTNGGYREHFFHLPAHADGRAVVAKVESESGGYKLETFTEDDPQWRYYHEFLWPDPRSMQYLMDRRVVQSLAANGDRHSVPRPVDHYVGVPDETSGQALLAEARGDGFGGEVERRDGEWMVHLERTDAVELDAIHAVVWGLHEMAERRGGYYDGWGCPVMK